MSPAIEGTLWGCAVVCVLIWGYIMWQAWKVVR